MVLAGDFTEGALTQLRSHGFQVLYFPYAALVASFKKGGIDARFDEETPDRECTAKIAAWNALGATGRRKIAAHLLKSQRSEVTRFVDALRQTIIRQIRQIIILPLHGSSATWDSIDAAIEFVTEYSENDRTAKPVARYEIEIRYNNGDSIRGAFIDKKGAVEFLRTYQPLLRPVP